MPNYCPECGEELEGDEKHCPECGESLTEGTEDSEEAEPDQAEDEQTKDQIQSEETGSAGVQLTLGSVISTLFGGFLLLGGLGFLVQGYFLSGVITGVLGAFLLPWTRVRLRQEYDVTFSRWLVIAITFVGMVAAGMTLPSSAQTGAGLDGGGFAPSQSPTEVTKSYFNKKTGLTQDFAGAYHLLADNATQESQSEWVTDENNVKRGMTRSGASFKLLSAKQVSKSENRAVVNLTIRMKQRGYIVGTETKRVVLIREDSKWRIEDEPEVYSVGS